MERHLLSPSHPTARNGIAERRNGIWKSILYVLYDTSRAELGSGALGVRDVANEARAAKHSVVKKGGYSTHFNPQSRNGGGSPAVEKGGITEYVRTRGNLRSRAKAQVLVIETQAGLREALRQRLGGVLGSFPKYVGRDAPTRRPKVGLRSALAQDSRMIWLRFLDRCLPRRMTWRIGHAYAPSNRTIGSRST